MITQGACALHQYSLTERELKSNHFFAIERHRQPTAQNHLSTCGLLGKHRSNPNSPVQEPEAQF